MMITGNIRQQVDKKLKNNCRCCHAIFSDTCTRPEINSHVPAENRSCVIFMSLLVLLYIKIIVIYNFFLRTRLWITEDDIEEGKIICVMKVGRKKVDSLTT